MLRMTLYAPLHDLQRWLPNPQPSQRHLQPVFWVPVLGGQVKRDGGLATACQTHHRHPSRGTDQILGPPSQRVERQKT